MIISEQLKIILYWVGLGCSLVVYAHANFTTKDELKDLRAQVSRQAEKEDIRRLERKIDKLTNYLLERK